MTTEPPSAFPLVLLKQLLTNHLEIQTCHTPSTKKYARACRMIINTKLGDLLLKASTTTVVDSATIALQSVAVPLIFAVHLLPFCGRFKISCTSSFVLAAAMAPAVSQVHLKYQSWTHLIVANSTLVNIFISAAIEEAF